VWSVSASLVTNSHALLAPALQMARWIELDGNSIEFILLNQFKSITPSSNRYHSTKYQSAFTNLQSRLWCCQTTLTHLSRDTKSSKYNINSEFLYWKHEILILCFAIPATPVRFHHIQYDASFSLHKHWIHNANYQYK